MSIFSGQNVSSTSIPVPDTIIDPANQKSWTSGVAVQDIGTRRLTANFSSSPVTTESDTQTKAWTLTGSNRITGLNQTLSGTGSKTIIQWFLTTNGSTRQGLSGTRSSSSADGWVFGYNRNAAGNLHYFHTGGSALDIAAGITSNRWIMASVTYNTTGGTVVLYSNQDQVGTASGFSGMTTPSYTGCLGEEDASFTTPLLGRLGLSLFWSQVLTLDQIRSVYTNTKSRYGL